MPGWRGIPFGGYNQYSVVRNEDGTYSVANGTDYGTEFDTSRTLYYTQRNQGRFIIVETKAPDGYYGDWTNIEQPGEAGTPLFYQPGGAAQLSGYGSGDQAGRV